MAASMDDDVELGFIEEVESWRLLSHFFPSKIGGKPAWLELDNLPTSEKLKCGRCGETCIFLMQLYANKYNLTPSAFHRTLFVFICRDPECCKTNSYDNLIVFRSQLPKVNKFYSDSPINEDNYDVNSNDFRRASDYQELCNVCDCPGKWKCGKCKKTNYCSKKHQITDWKAGHKRCCGNDRTGISYDTGILFKEYGLEIEAEEDEEEEAATVKKDDVDEMKEYSKVAETATAPDLSTEELQQMAGDTKEDEKFMEFKQIMEKNPEQVIRYQWGGQPIWVTDSHIPKADEIPPCEVCHSSRVFEFQVMPTLLHHIDVDCLDNSIDWGTLAIYSCSKSCDEGGNYGTEFIWKQDFVK